MEHSSIRYFYINLNPYIASIQ